MKKRGGTTPKNGRKSKEERDAWLTKQAEIKDQLDPPLETLWQDAPNKPNLGIKKYSDGKNTI
ncbi:MULTISPECIES: hypothetical protein [unclassified Lysinibacillus]|uniref:hypothetical protein n=1 Tax=unclassified Lysinibacillus TaxID=2636778 RepID=UPI0025575122|nr:MULTISPECIES: hypothetical protein [unclassified Lysinibacillus]MDM5247910.1 hypothetical protein [Lysinibacillus sp. G4S2]